MNKHRKSCWSLSQCLAAGVLAAAVLVMTAPFRGGEQATRMRTAAVLPILSTASIAHGASFQAFGSAERVRCSEESQFRSAVAAKRMQRREIVVRKSAGPSAESFQAPRTEWRHLTRAARVELDRLATVWQGGTVEIRGTGMRRGGLAELERLSRTLLPGGLGANAVLIGNGQGAADGAVQVKVEAATEPVALHGVGRAAGSPGATEPVAPRGAELPLYLAGNFHQHAPTQAQWEALDEVLDYLEMKTGRLAVRVQGAADAGEDAAHAGPGPLFPAESLLHALVRPGS